MCDIVFMGCRYLSVVVKNASERKAPNKASEKK